MQSDKNNTVTEPETNGEAKKHAADTETLLALHAALDAQMQKHEERASRLTLTVISGFLAMPVIIGARLGDTAQNLPEHAKRPVAIAVFGLMFVLGVTTFLVLHRNGEHVLWLRRALVRIQVELGAYDNDEDAKMVKGQFVKNTQIEELLKDNKDAEDAFEYGRILEMRGLCWGLDRDWLHRHPLYIIAVGTVGAFSATLCYLSLTY